MFKSLFEGFQYKRMALGIALFSMGYPIIFFLRDGLKLAPQSSVFTAICLALGLLLMIPKTLFRKYYSLNQKIAVPVLGWIGLCIFYLFIINPGGSSLSRELINYAMSFAFCFLLISTPDEVKDHALPVFILFIFLGNLGLFYSLLTNPFYVVGARASIYFDDEYGGNPHVFARNGFFGVIGSAILLFLTKENILYKLLALVNFFASLVTVILTQSRSTLLSVLLSLGVLLFFHFKLSNLKRIASTVFKPGNLIILLVVVYYVIYKISRMDFINLLIGISETFFQKFLDVFETSVQGADADEVADYSALQRVISFNTFKNTLLYNPLSLILGNGYRAIYMDFPILESMYNYGLAGIYFFGKSVIEIVKECYKSIRSVISPFSTFLGFVFIPITVSVFSQGQPNDTTFIYPFLLMARFMNFEKDVADAKPVPKAQTLAPVA